MAVLIVRRCLWGSRGVRGGAWVALVWVVSAGGACGVPEWPKAAVEAPGSKLYMDMRRLPQPYQLYSPQQRQKSKIHRLIFAASGRKTLASAALGLIGAALAACVIQAINALICTHPYAATACSYFFGQRTAR